MRPKSWDRGGRLGERGFTLVEVLFVLALSSIVLSMGAFAVRNFWINRSVEGSADAVVSQLRQLQERTVSESHPLVYGARFKVGSSSWGLVQYDPKGEGSADDSCKEVGTRQLEKGVVVKTVSFSDVAGVTTLCRTAISGAGSDQFIFFFARGSATEGSLVLEHPARTKTRTVSVSAITGRVSKS